MDYITHVVAFLVGLGAGFVLKINFNKESITQIGNKAGRDIVGRDNKK